MFYYTTLVPEALLLDPRLSATDKLVWIILRLLTSLRITGPVSDAALAQRCGLSRDSIRKGRLRLRATHWLYGPRSRGWRGRWARFPLGLLVDHELTNQAKILYAVLQVTEGFQDSQGLFTYRQLSNLTGLHPSTVKRAVRQLVNRRWLKIKQNNPRAPIHFVLEDPVVEKNKRLIGSMELRLKRASHLGEQITREFFNVLVDRVDFEDESSPGFLVNPYNDTEMRFDRYYPHDAAIEFNGPQHYGTTEKYPDPVEVLKQQARDAIKKAVCQSRGIHLMILHAEDLTLPVLRKKVDGVLPLRNLDEYGPLIAHLESIARSYRERAGGNPRRARSST